MLCVLLALCLPAVPVVQNALLDVSRLTFARPALVARVDASTLGGKIRRLSWSPDGTTLYLQSAEGKPPAEKVRHFTIALDGGKITQVDREPEWAAHYWAVKQDRTAPGVPSIVIEVQQKIENLKSGPGASGVLDRESNPTAVASGSPNMENLVNGQHGDQDATVVRLKLAGEDIAVWINERPVPGARFTWGPTGTGALVYLGEHGELVFLDQRKHHRRVPEVKDALLPAWSVDGSRLAYIQKSGRTTIEISWIAVGT